jgi:hypothetical protein
MASQREYGSTSLKSAFALVSTLYFIAAVQAIL